MSVTFNSVYPKVLKVEGGYQAMPSDTGNYSGGLLVGTNHGISAKTLEAVRGRKVTTQDMKSLTKDEAIQIYKKLYWDAYNIEQYPDHLRLPMFDIAVNSGNKGINWINQQLDLYRKNNQDSIQMFGLDEEQDTKYKTPQSRELVALTNIRKYYYENIATGGKAFVDGWLRRTDEIFHESLDFLSNNKLASLTTILIPGGIFFFSLYLIFKKH